MTSIIACSYSRLSCVWLCGSLSRLVILWSSRCTFIGSVSSSQWFPHYLFIICIIMYNDPLSFPHTHTLYPPPSLSTLVPPLSLSLSLSPKLWFTPFLALCASCALLLDVAWLAVQQWSVLLCVYLSAVCAGLWRGHTLCLDPDSTVWENYSVQLQFQS